MEFTLTDGRTESMSYEKADSRGIEEGSSDRCFTCYVNALELAETITATLQNKDGSILTNKYTVMNYIEYVQENWETMEKGKETLNLVNALQDYGYYMQQSGWKDDKDSHAAIPAKTVLNDNSITAAANAVSSMGIVKDLENSGIRNVKLSLILNEATVVRVSIKPEADTLIESASVTSGNGIPVSLSCDTESWIDSQKYYQFSTEKIGPVNLDKPYTFHVTTRTGDQMGEATITVSAMSYVDAVLRNTSTFAVEKKYAMTAYYYYYAAAARYAAS